jgi:hypothetical protein
VCVVCGVWGMCVVGVCVCVCVCVCVVCGVVLGIEIRALSMLTTCSTTDLHTNPSCTFFTNNKGKVTKFIELVMGFTYACAVQNTWANMTL